MCIKKVYNNFNKIDHYTFNMVLTRVEFLPRFKFTGKTVKNTKFTNNYR